MLVRIKNLKAEAIVGIHDWEKNSKRPIIINVEMELDGKNAVSSDNIADTLDYDEISQILIREAAKTSFGLIEKLAAHLVQIIMLDSRIIRARIEIDKPGAIKNAESVSVTEEVFRIK